MTDCVTVKATGLCCFPMTWVYSPLCISLRESRRRRWIVEKANRTFLSARPLVATAVFEESQMMRGGWEDCDVIGGDVQEEQLKYKVYKV